MGSNVMGFVIFGIICLATLFVGMWAGRKVKSTDDYWVAGRNLGPLVTISTQAATFIGGGMTVGWIGMGYTYGYGAFWYGIPQCLGLFIAGFLLVKSFRRTKYTSLPDWFDDIYHGDEKVKLAMTIVALVAPVTWVAGQFSAAGRMMEGILGIPLKVGIIIAAVVVVLYSVFGGFMAVAYTDTLQFIILFVLFMIVAPQPIAQVGGMSGIVKGAADYMLKPFSVYGMASITIPIWIFMGVTESLGLQTLYQRIYSAKSEGIARLGLVVAGLLTILWGILTPLVGMAIYAINPALESGDTSFSWFLANHTSTFIQMAFLACVVMATMSTADSMLNSVSLNISYDIYQKHIKKNATEAQALRVGRIVTLIFGIVSLYWAMQGGMIQSFFGYAASVSSGPLVASIFVTAFAKKKRCAKGIFWGLVAGVLVGIASIWMPVIKDILAGGVMFSFLTTVIVALIIGSTSANDGSFYREQDVKGGGKDVNMAKMLLQGIAPFNLLGR